MRTTTQQAINKTNTVSSLNTNRRAMGSMLSFIPGSGRVAVAVFLSHINTVDMVRVVILSVLSLNCKEI